jgi:hypothetical protein
VTDAPDDTSEAADGVDTSGPEAEPEADGVDPADAEQHDAAAHENDVVDTNVDRFIDRMVHGAGGAVAGNALVGMAKGMGLYKETELAAEIREVSPPDEDPDDPIEVTIDPDHPENTRIVYRMRTDDS